MKTESRSQNPEVRIQKTESRIQNPEDRIQKTESRSQNPEDRIQNLDEEKMLSFRIPLHQEHKLRVFLVSQGIGINHIVNAAMSMIIDYSEGRILNYDTKILEKIITKAKTLRTNTRYNRADKMRERHIKAKEFRRESRIQNPESRSISPVF